MAAYGLYTHIQSNKRRSVALLIGLFLLVYVMVFAGALLAEALTTHGYNGRYGGPPLDYLMRAAAFDFVKALPFATIGTVIWVFIAYKFHQSMIDAVTGARVVSRTEEPRLYNLLENLCISRGITMPTLRIADDEALNAFATGMNDKQYSITVTHGLIEALDDQEIEAVLGHELTHIRNGDVRMMVIAMVIAGVLGFFGELVFRIFFQNMMWGGGRRSRDSERGGGAGVAIVIAIALIALVWILSIVIRFALSRQREYLADFGLGRAHQKPRRHDLGATQDRRARRNPRRQFRRDGNVHRQPARGLLEYFRHPSVGGKTRRGAGEIRRRPRSGTARDRAAAGNRGRGAASGSARRWALGTRDAATGACPVGPLGTRAGRAAANPARRAVGTAAKLAVYRVNGRRRQRRRLCFSDY